jgi:hypothetical protein
MVEGWCRRGGHSSLSVNSTDRAGHVRRIQGGRHSIKQPLEDVVVPAVDDRRTPDHVEKKRFDRINPPNSPLTLTMWRGVFVLGRADASVSPSARSLRNGQDHRDRPPTRGRREPHQSCVVRLVTARPIPRGLPKFTISEHPIRMSLQRDTLVLLTPRRVDVRRVRKSWRRGRSNVAVRC